MRDRRHYPRPESSGKTTLTSHAIAEAIKIAKTMSSDENLVINLSGRGDKDVEEVQRLLN